MCHTSVLNPLSCPHLVTLQMKTSIMSFDKNNMAKNCQVDRKLCIIQVKIYKVLHALIFTLIQCTLPVCKLTSGQIQLLTMSFENPACWGESKNVEIKTVSIKYIKVYILYRMCMTVDLVSMNMIVYTVYIFLSVWFSVFCCMFYFLRMFSCFLIGSFL